MGSIANNFTHSMEPNCEFIPQHLLDISTRTSTSLYPWKGQFSPDFMAALLDAYANPGDSILDPFLGSGTLLYECARRDHIGYGSEINPAARQLAGMVAFCALNLNERLELTALADSFMEQYLSDLETQGTLFETARKDGSHVRDISRTVKEMVAESPNELTRRLITTSVMLSMGNSDKPNLSKIRIAYRTNVSRVMSLPYSCTSVKVLAEDARRLSLPSSSIDLVITSPPYINVFNYHQNYRKAMEIMGWKPLSVANSEIGANRKHRANRFLTVIQYCMDLYETLAEIRRVLTEKGTVIFVIGRESTIRGERFENSKLLSQVANLSGYRVLRCQERRFTNRYGRTIYEDIISLKPLCVVQNDIESARTVGINALKAKLPVENSNVHNDIAAAIERGSSVTTSPVLKS